MSGTSVSVLKGLVDKVLGSLLVSIEECNTEGAIDCDIADGMLKITDGTTVYLLSWHESSGQIWVASPSSGSVRFVYNEKEDLWFSDRTGEELLLFVKKEVGIIFGLFKE